MVPAEQEVLVAQCDKHQVIVKFHFPDAVNLFLLLKGKIYICIYMCVCGALFLKEE